MTGYPIGLVNGRPFDPDRVDFRIGRGTTEIWTITSTDPPGIAHIKDTVHLAAGETVRVQATFDGHLGRYVYHCHFPEHSAIGMMAQGEVVA